MCQRVQMSRLREPKFVYVGYKDMVLSSRQMGFVVLSCSLRPNHQLLLLSVLYIPHMPVHEIYPRNIAQTESVREKSGFAYINV